MSGTRTGPDSMTAPRRAAGGALVALVALVAPALVAAAPVASPSAVQRAAPAARTAGPTVVRSVVAVSLDGLNPDAITQLGPEGAPTLHRLIRRGASTLNARTSVKRTETLPNHTGMLTGRNIDRRWRGHGIEHNTLRPGTVQRYAGHGVASVYSVARRHGGSGGLFASKKKFVLFRHSWRPAIPRYAVRENSWRLVGVVRRDLLHRQRAFRLVHLSAPDVAGHRHGFMSPDYLDAVRRVDAQLGRIVNTIANTARLRRRTALVVTADHGGLGRHGHAQADRLANYRIPFLVWGRGVTSGADLYDLNPDYADPGTSRPGWGTAQQPVRNTAVANLALDLLGLPAVAGSRADRGQDLDWR